MNIESIISGVKNIAISGHVRPDGDCVGSCLGLYNYLTIYYPDKEVTVYLEEIPAKFGFLKGANHIKNKMDIRMEEVEQFDVYFALDCGSSDRLGYACKAYENAKVKCVIDHHISNKSIGENFYVVPTASSTSELVYNLIPSERLTKEIAECLYLGIAHDTGVFQYSNVAPSTMRAAADMLELGVLGSKIVEDTFFEKTYAQNKVLGKAFFESELLLDGRCVFFALTLEQMQELGITTKDLDGIVSQMRNTQGVDIAVFMYELSESEYKISLRTNDKIDASIIATTFQGGGHKKAAGFTLSGSQEELLSILLQEIKKQISL
ncbi:MAG: bifunctional oligoribonuclease/PAP phosphatase NrnA [Eubacteriales bacterium]